MRAAAVGFNPFVASYDLLQVGHPDSVTSIAVRDMKVRRTVSAILTPFAVVLLIFTVMARIDSHEEHVFIRALDVAIGLMLAASFVLAPQARPVRRLTAAIGAVAVWLLVSGSLVWWHGFQVYARTTAVEHGLTRSRILQSYEALTAYSRDCGSFPSETQGLDALCQNPGLARWRGPYSPDMEFLSDAWGHRLRYAFRYGRPVVWSCGKDGINGTDDDVNVDEEDHVAGGG